MVRECKGEPAAGDIAPVAINSHPIVRVGEDGSLSRCKDTVDTLRVVLAALLFSSCELGKTVEECVHRKPHNIWPSAGLGKVANRNSPNMPRRDPSPSIELPINIYKKNPGKVVRIQGGQGEYFKLILLASVLLENVQLCAAVCQQTKHIPKIVGLMRMYEPSAHLQPSRITLASSNVGVNTLFRTFLLPASRGLARGKSSQQRTPAV